MTEVAASVTPLKKGLGIHRPSAFLCFYLKSSSR